MAEQNKLTPQIENERVLFRAQQSVLTDISLPLQLPDAVT